MSAAPTRTPGGYRMIFPPGWQRIRLTGDGQRARVHELVTRKLSGMDAQQVARLRPVLEQELMDQVEEAQRVNGLDLHLLTEPVKGAYVDASCVVALAPVPGVVGQTPGVAELIELRRGRARPGERITEVTAAGAPAMKVASTLDDHPHELVQGRSVRICRYYVPVPGGTDHLVVTFSTTTVPVHDAMEVLFDSMVEQLQWQ